MAVQQALGDIIGLPIMSATGLELSMRYWRAYLFVSYEDDGSTVLTFTQHTTDAAGDPATEIALEITNLAYKFAGVGGTAAAGPVPAAGVYDLVDDTTRDAMAIEVRADQLAEGYDWVECSTDGGVVIAIPHAPRYKLPVLSLPSPLVHP